MQRPRGRQCNETDLNRLGLRLRSRSVIEAFAMGGRQSMIRRVYPKQFNASIGAAVVYNPVHAAASARPSLVAQQDQEHDSEPKPEGKIQAAEAKPESPLVTLTVWEMHSAYNR